MQTIGTPALWIGFLVFVLAMLALDLGVFNRKAHAIGFKTALRWTGVWISVALIFGGIVYWKFGAERSLQFYTGWLIEYALSVDNIFVMLVIFTTFAVPQEYRHKVLYWGILGALVMRAVFIFAGTALIQRFHAVMYLFGAILIYTGIKLFVQKDEEPHPENNRVFRWFRRMIPSTNDYRGAAFFVLEEGRKATPLFLVVVLVEITDLIFAVDSIPAIFAVSTDPFIVFTSNIFAILGLRSLFFVLSGAMGKFHFLNVGLAFVLVFVGGKMLIENWVHIPIQWSLVAIAGILGVSIGASLIWPAEEDSSDEPVSPDRK